MSDAAKPNPDQVETDERFPSGEWLGFWLQHGFTGRQWMRGVRLTFSAGRVEGAGTDCVGHFTFSGTYDLDTGKCEMVKQYLGQHPVQYRGQNENDGKWLWGVWQIPGDRGGFHLWPKGEADPTVQRLAEEIDIPVEEAVPVA